MQLPYENPEFILCPVTVNSSWPPLQVLMCFTVTVFSYCIDYRFLSDIHIEEITN